MTSTPPRVTSILAIALLLAAAGFASDLDENLNQHFRGAWAILEVEVYSACSGTYSDNQVSNAGVASKAAQRFEAGELIFNVLLAQGLQACRVPVPSAP